MLVSGNAAYHNSRTTQKRQNRFVRVKFKRHKLLIVSDFLQKCRWTDQVSAPRKMTTMKPSSIKPGNHGTDEEQGRTEPVTQLKISNPLNCVVGEEYNGASRKRSGIDGWRTEQFRWTTINRTDTSLHISIKFSATVHDTESLSCQYVFHFHRRKIISRCSALGNSFIPAPFAPFWIFKYGSDSSG